MEISKNSKFYISPEEMVVEFPEEMVAKFKDRRNINILCFNKIMALMVEYPNRAGDDCMNYYFSAIFKDVVNLNDGLLLCTYKFGIKNKKGDIIFKNFCFTNKDEEYLALEKAIESFAIKEAELIISLKQGRIFSNNCCFANFGDMMSLTLGEFLDVTGQPDY